MSEYEVTIVKYGTRNTVRSEVYLNYHLYAEQDSPIGMDYFFWIVRNSERTVLVDTGFSRHGGATRNRTTLIDPMAAYTALGVDPATAPTIVVTHAHYDHIGNLSEFPRSSIVIASKELAFWQGPHAHQPQFHHSVEDDELASLAAANRDGRVITFDECHEIAPGIQAIQLGGHTPGQSAVLVSTSAGSVLLASDAIHYYEEYERRMPFTSVANLVEMYGAFGLVDEMISAGKVDHLVSGHDPDTLNRFEPVKGELHGLVATIGQLR